MGLVTAKELAEQLGRSKGAVSQWVSSGKLDGCFSGTGRNRLFDLEKCAVALGRNIDAGQALGNGAETKKAARTIATGKRKPVVEADEQPSRYEIARTEKIEQELRKSKRENEKEEGKWVLASEYHRIALQRIGREVAEFETVLRDSARQIADDLAVDNKEVRKILRDNWRSFRKSRAEELVKHIPEITMTDVEKRKDI